MHGRLSCTVVDDHFSSEHADAPICMPARTQGRVHLARFSQAHVHGLPAAYDSEPNRTSVVGRLLFSIPHQQSHTASSLRYVGTALHYPTLRNLGLSTRKSSERRCSTPTQASYIICVRQSPGEQLLGMPRQQINIASPLRRLLSSKYGLLPQSTAVLARHLNI